jgi:hypothetical protein
LWRHRIATSVQCYAGTRNVKPGISDPDTNSGSLGSKEHEQPRRPARCFDRARSAKGARRTCQPGAERSGSHESSERAIALAIDLMVRRGQDIELVATRDKPRGTCAE